MVSGRQQTSSNDDVLSSSSAPMSRQGHMNRHYPSNIHRRHRANAFNATPLAQPPYNNDSSTANASAFIYAGGPPPASPELYQQTSLLATPPPSSEPASPGPPPIGTVTAVTPPVTSSSARLDRTEDPFADDSDSDDDDATARHPEEIVFGIFVEGFTVQGLKSRAFCIFPSIRAVNPPNSNHSTYNKLAGGRRDQRRAFARYVKTCVRCLEQEVIDGFAAIEFLHYCYGGDDVAEEKILNIPRICCLVCARDVFGIHLPFIQPSITTEEQANLVFSRSVCTSVLTVAFGSFTRNVIEQAVAWCRDEHVVRARAESLSRLCAYCGVAVPSARDVELDARVQVTMMAAAAANRQAVDNFIGTRQFQTLQFSTLVRLLNNQAGLTGDEPLNDVLYGFLENLANALIENARASDTDNLQVRKPFGVHAYQYKDRPGLFRFPKRFCSSLCEDNHKYAVSEVQRRTVMTTLAESMDTDDVAMTSSHDDTTAMETDDAATTELRTQPPAIASHRDILRRHSLVHLQHMFLAAAFSRVVSGDMMAAFIDDLDRQIRLNNECNQMCCWCRRQFASNVSSDRIVWGQARYATHVFCYCSGLCEQQARQLHSTIYRQHRQKPVTDLYTLL